MSRIASCSLLLSYVCIMGGLRARHLMPAENEALKDRPSWSFCDQAIVKLIYEINKKIDLSTTVQKLVRPRLRNEKDPRKMRKIQRYGSQSFTFLFPFLFQIFLCVCFLQNCHMTIEQKEIYLRRQKIKIRQQIQNIGLGHTHLFIFSKCRCCINHDGAIFSITFNTQSLGPPMVHTHLCD